MGKIKITGMEFFAFHGHYPEEKLAGNKFSINISIKTNTSKAGKSDDIADALNYQSVYLTIKDTIEETNSNLLENLAKNILNNLFNEYPEIKAAKLELNKLNPPMGGQIHSVGVVIKKKRSTKNKNLKKA